MVFSTGNGVAASLDDVGEPFDPFPSLVADPKPQRGSLNWHEGRVA